MRNELVLLLQRALPTWNKLADHYRQSGYLTQKLKRKMNRLGQVQPKVIPLLVIAGNSHYFLKNRPKQAEYLEQAQENAVKVYGKDHPVMLMILLNLATALRGPRNYRQIALLNQALVISRQIFGITHPLTGIILINLKNACTKVNDRTGALKHGKNAYEIFKKFFGETHTFCKNSKGKYF